MFNIAASFRMGQENPYDFHRTIALKAVSPLVGTILRKGAHS